MTAHYNIFKDSTTQCAEPSTTDAFVSIAQGQDQAVLRGVPSLKQYPHSVENCPNVRRGHDVSNGAKSDGY